MYFKQILDELCGCASYVIASRESLEAAIVDPAILTDQYLELLAERGYRLKYVIDTHVHADHISGARKLAAETGADLCLQASAEVRYPFHRLSDGEVLELGQLRLHVVHTPGHRKELISILVVNPPRSSEPSMVLTGDCLLVGDVGRPDFGGGDASQQFDSVSTLLKLPDWVAVFPGHFEGPCGRGMCGRPSTTIGFERRFNPMTGLGRETFITSVNESVPARPLNMVAIEATNRGAMNLDWAMLISSPVIEQIDNATLDRAIELDDESKIAILDVREPQEFADGHITGAINLPQAELATRFDEAPRDRPIVTVCAHGSRSLRAAQFLKQQGIIDVVSLEGGTEGWRESGRPIDRELTTAADPALVEAGRNP